MNQAENVPARPHAEMGATDTGANDMGANEGPDRAQRIGKAPHVSIERASKWYGNVLGVNEVTLDLFPGVTGLLGPNGAGKSTLIKMICGMLQPSLGKVRVHGLDPVLDRHARRELGLCPEQDPTYSGIPARAVLHYLLRLHGFDEAESAERAHVTLDRVGLAGALDRPVAGYSKGMRQRFKLAQALAHEPSVLVLDEPMNGLDPPTRREFVDVLRAEGAAGRCVLVSSHILHEVESVAERLVVMQWGRTLADGTARELREELVEVPRTVLVRTDDPTALAVRIAGLEGVRKLAHVQQGLEVHTTHPELLFDRLAAWAAAENGPRIQAMVPSDESLEAVFEYLTR